MLNVIMLSVVVLNAIMLSVVLLNVRKIAVVQDLFNCLNHSINCHKLFTPASSKSFHAKVLKVKVGKSQRHKMNRLLMS